MSKPLKIFEKSSNTYKVSDDFSSATPSAPSPATHITQPEKNNSQVVRLLLFTIVTLYKPVKNLFTIKNFCRLIFKFLCTIIICDSYKQNRRLTIIKKLKKALIFLATEERLSSLEKPATESSQNSLRTHSKQKTQFQLLTS